MKRTWMSALLVFAMVIPMQALANPGMYGHGMYGGMQGCEMASANGIYSKDDEMKEIEDQIRDLKDERKELKDDLKDDRKKLDRYTKIIRDTLTDEWSEIVLGHMAERYCCNKPGGTGSEGPAQQDQSGEKGGGAVSYIDADFVDSLPVAFQTSIEVPATRMPASVGGGRAPAKEAEPVKKETAKKEIKDTTGEPAKGYKWTNGACKDKNGNKVDKSNCSPAPVVVQAPPPVKQVPPPVKQEPPVVAPPPVVTQLPPTDPFVGPGGGGGGMCVENPGAVGEKQGWYKFGVCKDGGIVDTKICTFNGNPNYRKPGTNGVHIAQCVDAISKYRKAKQALADRDARLTEIEVLLAQLADAKKDRKREIKKEIRDGDWEAGCPDGSCYGQGGGGSRINKTSLLVGAGLSILGGVGGYMMGKGVYNTAAKYNAMTGNTVDPYGGMAAMPYVAAGASLGYPFIAGGLYGGAYGGVNGGMGCAPGVGQNGGGPFGYPPGMGMPGMGGGMYNPGMGPWGMGGPMGGGMGGPGMGMMMGGAMGMPMGGAMGMPMGGMMGAGAMMGGAMGMPMGGMMGMPMGGAMGMPMGGAMMGAAGGLGMDYQQQMMQMQMQQYQMHMGMQQRYMENAAAKMRVQQGLMTEYYSLMYRFNQLQSGAAMGGGIGGGIGIGGGFGGGYGGNVVPVGGGYGGGQYGGGGYGAPGYGGGYAGGPVIVPVPGSGGAPGATPPPITGR